MTASSKIRRVKKVACDSPRKSVKKSKKRKTSKKSSKTSRSRKSRRSQNKYHRQQENNKQQQNTSGNNYNGGWQDWWHWWNSQYGSSQPYHDSTRDKYLTFMNLPSNATKPEIRSAYLKLSVKYHPDKGGSSEQFRKLDEAYKYLY